MQIGNPTTKRYKTKKPDVCLHSYPEAMVAFEKDVRQNKQLMIFVPSKNKHRISYFVGDSPLLLWQQENHVAWTQLDTFKVYETNSDFGTVKRNEHWPEMFGDVVVTHKSGMVPKISQTLFNKLFAAQSRLFADMKQQIKDEYDNLSSEAKNLIMLIFANDGCCLVCKKQGCSTRCEICRTKYCSRTCQKKNWKNHKKLCKQVAKHTGSGPSDIYEDHQGPADMYEDLQGPADIYAYFCKRLFPSLNEDGAFATDTI